MLSELTEAARRFRREGKLRPEAYKPKAVNWIIDLADPRQPQLLGPFRGTDVRRFEAPHRQRSGKIGPANIKPYLLVDDARYALGMAEPGREAEAALAHGGFVRLLEQAREATESPELARILAFLADPDVQARWAAIPPRDIVTFRCAEEALPFEREPLQRFWATYLAEAVLLPESACCAVCGRPARILRTLPNEIAILGQKCQVSSFNLPAFESFGKRQTANAPLCYPCTAGAIQALDYLVRTPRHRAVVARGTSKSGRVNPLRNQLAVFWLKTVEPVAVRGEMYDLEEALGALLQELARPEPQAQRGPPAELAHLQALLAVPWTADRSATYLDINAFHLAVLSANKGRLVVRSWITASLEEVRTRLGAFLRAQRIVDPTGAALGVFPIPALLEPLASSDPHLVGGLLRTAYEGMPPPGNLVAAAVQRCRVPETLARESPDRAARQQALLAVLKLALTYGTEDAERMETLDSTRNAPAYLCGRLLAVLEEAQRRASRGRVNATLVDRFYGAASATPATTIAQLLTRAQTAHLPQIRRARRGYAQIEQLLEDVLAQLDAAGGFPRSLTLTEQGEFALGFYHQRAAFHAAWARDRTDAAKRAENED